MKNKYPHIFEPRSTRCFVIFVLFRHISRIYLLHFETFCNTIWLNSNKASLSLSLQMCIRDSCYNNVLMFSPMGGKERTSVYLVGWENAWAWMPFWKDWRCV